MRYERRCGGCSLMVGPRRLCEHAKQWGMMCSVSHKLSFSVLGCADRPYGTKTSESRIARIAISKFRTVARCAHNLLQLGPPWGTGVIPPTSQGWQDSAWSPLGAKHTPPRPHSAWRTPYSTVPIAVRVSYGGVHTIFSI